VQVIRRLRERSLICEATAMTAQIVFGEDTWSGEETDRIAQQLAAGMAALGVNDGDTVAMMLRNDPAYPQIIQACRIAGAYFCPINWHFKANEVAYLLKDSGAKLLFVYEDLLPGIQQVVPLATRVIVVKPHPAVAQAYALPDVALDQNYRRYDEWLPTLAPYDGPLRMPRGHIAYTSGTTGKPKGVRRYSIPPGDQTEQQALALETVRVAFGIDAGVRSLVSAPIYHSAPSLFVQQSLLQGSCLVIEPRFDAERTLALIEKHRIETVYLVPVMYVRLLRLPDEVRARYDLSSLRFVASTGSPCAPDIKQGMIDWLGPVIFETYASSETGLVTVIDPLESLQRPGSAGRPIGGAVVKILDADRKPCPPGEIGMIYVKQPAYPDFTYNNNQLARREIEHDGLIHIGDLGYLDDDGYLYVCDRSSDMVISGGVNIYPVEIENVLINHPGVSDCAVFGIPDDEYGEALAMAVIATPGSGLTVDMVRNYLKPRIADYKVPQQIELVAELPRDDNGKVAKRRLRDGYWEGQDRRI
jgi:long-chain acyl-CoA synthetase